MSIFIYPVEKHQRDLKRKIWAGLLFALALCMSLFGGNFLGPTSGIYLTWSGVGATLFLIVLAAIYMYAYQQATAHTVEMELTDQGLVINGEVQSRNELQGFDIELDPTTQEMVNIILLYPAKHRICTLASTQDEISMFVEALSKYIPMTNNYSSTKIETRMRMLKL